MSNNVLSDQITPTCRVVRSTIWGETVYFTITTPNDLIQKFHSRGEFYEAEELDIIHQYFPLGGVFCDIGSNIGNHSLFALKFLHARQAILFEPNPVAIEVLRSNMMLNGLLDRCVLDYLGQGLADDEVTGFSISAPKQNLGGGRLIPGEGEIRVIPGDFALQGRHVDFIKIDVEGMEVRVLEGLKRTIERCRPRLFIEVNSDNRRSFMNWVRKNDYQVATDFCRYPGVRNFMLLPGEASVQPTH